MELEFKDLEKLGDKVKEKHFKQKVQTEFIISLLEDRIETPDERYMLENLKFDLLDKDISILCLKMQNETLDKIADVYEKARVELEKIIAEASPKE